MMTSQGLMPARFTARVLLRPAEPERHAREGKNFNTHLWAAYDHT
jgi:hypothetical protein